MKTWLSGAMLVLCLFTGICVAQVPAPPLAVPSSSELSFNFIVTARDPSSPYYGVGGQVTASHYMSEWLGFQAEGDFSRTNVDNFRDIGVRVGPIARFRSHRAIQPYVHALVGVAEVKASYLTTPTSFNTAPSILLGAGAEFPLSQHWHGNIGGDLQEDWTSHRGTVVRGVAGVSYRFGTR